MGSILEDCGMEIHYIPGPENIVAYDMSRIPIIDDDIEVKQLYACTILTARGSCARTEDITEECLLDAGVIAHHQKMELRQSR